jgi:hypothetical protein
MVQSTTTEETQRYARHEILICADALERQSESESEQALFPAGVALFAAAVREYLHAELEIEGRRMNPTDDKRARLVLAEVIEKAFVACPHPYASDPTIAQQDNWCIECGAVYVPATRTWVRPHWRTILLRALLAGVLLLIVGCGGSALDVGSTAVELVDADVGADSAGSENDSKAPSSGCLPGWADCDGDPRNGCETSLRTALNCGYCSHFCAGDAGCGPLLTCQ